MHTAIPIARFLKPFRTIFPPSLLKMGKFVFLFPYQFFKYQLDFTNFILVNTNSLFFPRQYTRFNKGKSQKNRPLAGPKSLPKGDSLFLKLLPNS